MASMSAIPPPHVPSASLLQQQSPTRKSTEWPALSPSKKLIKDHNATTNDAVDESWEMLPDDGHDEATTTPQISFCVVEPLQVEMDDINDNSNDDNNAEKRCSLMHHCQSTPDFHNYETILEETCNVEAVLIEHEEEEEDDEEEFDGSSSMVMVSGPPSVLSESCWSSGGASSSSKISFRDAIMKKHTVAGSSPGTQEEIQPKMVKKKKPTFVVSPIKRPKSTGDLRSLARIAESNIHQQYDDDGGGFGGGGGGGGGDEIIVGETDAELFYNQKAKGKVGRKNGKKIRPDEKKRLDIIMAKKDDQRQRQQQSQPSQAAEKKGKKNKKDELK